MGIFGKRASFGICLGYIRPCSPWGKNSLQKTKMSIYHSQDPEVATRLPLRQQPWERRLHSQVCLLYTHWMHFPITHLANRKESQTGLDAWPKTAPVPLCSDKWPISKSGSLWTIEGELDQLEMIRVTQFCSRDRIREAVENRLKPLARWELPLQWRRK